ncbi:filamentous hemagglutinin N-terminal domain-containing protein [Thiotrichales bacterium HSG1]|nr:filamentous hemagglutinin N-terminal domain-containing protein [Thiotrichales bacterium HSG1]
MKYLLLIFLLITILSSNAEIITDGTLSRNINLPGPNFKITPDLGQQHGGNLFHSFQEFNLNSSESATFSGPNSVQNILSRVTGGKPSNIDGLIRSTIPNADMYFLNPNGIMFGPNARLDVQGSFHASTADYLRLGENGRFDARNQSDSLLTVAPVEAFGFLANSPASITVKHSHLSVPKTLSLIANDLNLIGQDIVDENGTIQFDTTIEHPFFPSVVPITTAQLIAKAGRINLISIGNSGETNLIYPKQHTGQLTAHKININAENGGDIFIRAGKIKLTDTQLQAQIFNEQQGGIIDIQANTITMQGIDTFSSILTNTNGIGQGGTININAKQFHLSQGVAISSNSYSSGDAGAIKIKVENDFEFIGKLIPELNLTSSIFSYTFSLEPAKGGNVEIEAGKLSLFNGTLIGAGTFGSEDAGTVSLKIKNDLIISGFQLMGIWDFPSGITTKSFVGDPIFAELYTPEFIGGKSGNIEIEADKIMLNDRGIIQADTNRGDGGHIKITANQLTLKNGGNIGNATFEQGDGGQTIINLTGQLLITDSHKSNNVFGVFDVFDYSGIYSGSSSLEENAGMGGEILIQADSVKLEGNAFISTETRNSAGGNITLNTSKLLNLKDGKIITSVRGGIGNGGNITIENPTFVVLNQGQIKAQADAGHGGNIHIKSDQFITSPNSLISASSKLGIDGEVAIESIDVDLTGALRAFGTNFLNAAAHMKRPCTVEDILNKSTFYIFSVNGSQPSPADFIANELVLIEEEEEIDLKAKVKEAKSVDWTGCRPNLTLNKI